MDLPDPSIVTAVQDLYARYAHRIDRRDFDGFAALFTEDAELIVGDSGCHGRDAVPEFMAGLMKSPGGAHIITNVSVRPAGKDRWSAMADYLLTRRAEEGGPWGIVGVGWYESVATWVGGEWYFAEHRIMFR
jgi:ketosteroid isomerase-like protein